MGYSSDDDHPPPDVRRMVASIVPFLVRMSPCMEKSVTSNTDLFAFFNSSDPYHSYFQHQLSQHRNQVKKQPEDDCNYKTGGILPHYWDIDIVLSPLLLICFYCLFLIFCVGGFKVNLILYA